MLEYKGGIIVFIETLARIFIILFMIVVSLILIFGLVAIAVIVIDLIKEFFE